MNPEEFEQSVWYLLDGSLDEDGFQKLEEYLTEHDEAQEQFVRMVDLHGILIQKLSDQVSPASVFSMDEVVRRQKRRYFKQSALAAAAVLVLVAMVMKGVFMKPAEPLLTIRHSEDAVFHVTHAGEVDPDQGGLMLEKGSRLQLTQGGVELSLRNGVQALVRAPADLTLHDDDRIYQSLGISHFVVPPSGVGFQVQTPDLLVTDLGTEFGVISSPDELDQVHLFKGKVEVENHWGLRHKELLVGLQSRGAGPAGRLNPVDSRPELFMTSLEDKPSHLRLSFDDLKHDEFEVSGSHPDTSGVTATLLDSTREDKRPGMVSGKFGKALELHGHGGCVQTNWPGISGRSPRSVAFWVKLPADIEGAHKQRGFLTWGDTNVEAGKFELIANRHKSIGPRGAIRFDCGKGHVVGETNLYDGEWHHVAVVMGGAVDPASGMKVQLYVDGELETITGFLRNEPDTIPGTDESSWMSVGRYLHAGSPNEGYLIGTLDELYVFSGALTQADIRQVMNGDW